MAQSAFRALPLALQMLFDEVSPQATANTPVTMVKPENAVSEKNLLNYLKINKKVNFN